MTWLISKVAGLGLGLIGFPRPNLSSIKWAALAMLAALFVIVPLGWGVAKLFGKPSAVTIAKQDGRREAQLEDAAKALLAENNALKAAAQENQARLSERASELSAFQEELMKKERENAALRAQAPDKSAPVFTSDDPWFNAGRMRTQPPATKR
jgi:hypothetical protein